MPGDNTTILNWQDHDPDTGPMVGTSRCISYNMPNVRRAVRLCVQELPDLQETFARANTVLLKPNLLSCTHGPERHVNTHPAVVRAIAEVLIHDFDCDVSIGDSCGTIGEGSTNRAMAVSGVADIVEDLRLRLYNVDAQPRHTLPVPDSRLWKQIPLPANLRQFDLIVSVAKLKTHMLTLLTGAVKNVFGLVPGQEKKRAHVQAPKPDDFATLVCDLYAHVRPGAAFIDGVIAMEGAGPTNGELRHLELVAASCDPVALDAFCAQVVGLSPMEVPLLAQCHERWLGTATVADLTVRGEGAAAFAPDSFARPPTYASGGLARLVPNWLVRTLLRTFTFRHAVIDQSKCERCGECARNCLSQAIRKVGTRYRVNRRECISCYCCTEVCPYDAIDVAPQIGTRLAELVRAPFRREPAHDA